MATAKRVSRISRIRLITAMPFGPSSIVEQSIGVDSYYSAKEKVTLGFDVDDRFIRCDIGTWSGLIPLSNVGMITVEPVSE